MMIPNPFDESGEALKNAALLLHEAQRSGLLLEVRRRFVQCLLARGTATVDDARAGVVIPTGIDPVCLGAVPGALARANIIRRNGYRASMRPEAHARPLSEWRLLDSEKAKAWLRAHPERPAVQSGQAELFTENEEPGRGNAPAN